MLGAIGHSDRRLLQATRHGEAEAFALFYRRYADLVLAYYLRRVRSPELAADLMMEVFAAALASVTRPGTEIPAKPAQWLFGVAHHKLIDAYRRGRADDRAREALGMEPVDLDDEDIERINRLTDEDQVVSLLDQLPGAQRDAIRARVFEDQSYDEIAAVVGSSSMVVRKRVSRALQQLRSAVEEPR